jgi:carotenoid cleavage dioxygenase
MVEPVATGQPTTRGAVLAGIAATGVAVLAGCAREPSDAAANAAPSVGPTRSGSLPARPPGAGARLLDRAASTRRPSSNPFLAGNFAPAPFETTALNLPIVGQVPNELHGTLFRVGPNPLQADPTRYHWFLGTGMVHAFTFDEGRVSYRSRWVRTDTAADALRELRTADLPRDPYPIPNGANTTIVAHAGRLLATYEAALPTEMGADLTTRGRYDFGGALGTPMTAHAKVDPSTGELIFFGIDLLSPPYLHYYRASRSGEIVETRAIDLPGPSMMHDFGITERHAVFIDVPVVYNPFGLPERPIPAAWRSDYATRIGVMPRVEGGAVRWFEIDPCYVGHVLNAYDDGDRVVLDGTRHTAYFDRDLYGVGEGSVSLDRWTMDLATGAVSHDVLDDRSQEMPRIDDRRTGRRHRFGYTVLSDQEAGRLALGGLVKHDLQSGSSSVAGLPESAQACEPVFLPRAGSTEEDDGWVVSVVYDEGADLSTLVIIDAQDFAAPPVASIPLGVRVPHHFHGTFVPS